jgi:hypothetical protein
MLFGRLPLLLGNAISHGGRRDLLADTQARDRGRSLLARQARVCSGGVDQWLPVGKLSLVGGGSSATPGRRRGCSWTPAGRLLGSLAERAGQSRATAWAAIVGQPRGKGARRLLAKADKSGGYLPRGWPGGR